MVRGARPPEGCSRNDVLRMETNMQKRICERMCKKTNMRVPTGGLPSPPRSGRYCGESTSEAEAPSVDSGSSAIEAIAGTRVESPAAQRHSCQANAAHFCHLFFPTVPGVWRTLPS